MPIENQQLEFPEYLDFKRRHVPPSLNENVFRVPVAYESDPVICAARDALRAGRVAAEKCLEIAGATLTNETMTEVARHKAAADAIYQASHPIMERMQSAIERVTKKLGAMNETLMGPPAPITVVGQWQAMELRSAFAAMTRADRRKHIAEAIRSGNQLVVGAVLRCPAFLAGLDELEQQDFRLQWQRQTHPNEVEYLALLGQVDDHLSRGGQLLLNYTLGLTNMGLVQRANQSHRRASDAIASVSAAH